MCHTELLHPAKQHVGSSSALCRQSHIDVRDGRVGEKDINKDIRADVPRKSARV